MEQHISRARQQEKAAKLREQQSLTRQNLAFESQKKAEDKLSQVNKRIRDLEVEN